MVARNVAMIPLEVSPLIKLARWTSLIAGVIHGFVFGREHVALEKIRREHEEKGRAAREEYLRLEKLRLNAVEMKELETMFLGTVSSSDEATVCEVASNES